jgi:hypothetical protein
MRGAGRIQEGIDINIHCVTYVRVGAGLTPQPPELQEIEPPVAEFLRAHVDDLITKATKDDATPPAQFTDVDAQELFRDLHTGSEAEFLKSTGQLATRLIARMNRVTAEGLLLALRATHGTGVIAGLLKLQVVAERGAVLERLENGGLQLSAVKDLLEKPGDLQKGALVTSALSAGQVYCADKLTQAAQYFPDAFGIRIYAKPSAATKAFFDAAQLVVPDLVAPIAQRWPTLQPGTVRDVLAELSEALPDLQPQLQEEMIETLESAARPVLRLDTTRRVKETLRAGDVTIFGPIEAMRQRVTTAHMESGEWQTMVSSDDEPKITHGLMTGK